MSQFDPTLPPYIVQWHVGRGYHSTDTTQTFATLAEAVAAYNGPRPSKSVCDVWLRDWRLDNAQPEFTDLRRTMLASRSWDYANKRWVRRETRLQAVAA